MFCFCFIAYCFFCHFSWSALRKSIIIWRPFYFKGLLMWYRINIKWTVSILIWPFSSGYSKAHQHLYHLLLSVCLPFHLSKWQSWDFTCSEAYYIFNQDTGFTYTSVQNFRSSNFLAQLSFCNHLLSGVCLVSVHKADVASKTSIHGLQSPWGIAPRGIASSSFLN